MIHWLLVDDQKEESSAFARHLSDEDISIEAVRASEVQNRLTKGELDISGILMDVDLSGEVGLEATGPGIAQNVRVGQQLGKIPAFPIVRFSFRERVLANIGNDSSSDDVFDLKIDKDGLSQVDNGHRARLQLRGISQIYRAALQKNSLLELLGVDEERSQIWGHPAFDREFESADRPHLKAGRIVKLITNPGILIDRDHLLARLGISSDSPGLKALFAEMRAFSYAGTGSAFFERWWARAVEGWWSSLGAPSPLAGTSIRDRHEVLSKKIHDLQPLDMPGNSPGDRPWRRCFITFEEKREFLPVDPSKAVRVTPREPLAVWIDPLVAALGPALKARNDPRLNRADAEKLSLLLRRGG